LPAPLVQLFPFLQQFPQLLCRFLNWFINYFVNFREPPIFFLLENPHGRLLHHFFCDLLADFITVSYGIVKSGRKSFVMTYDKANDQESGPCHD
jgi:hypothetical protein